MTWKKVNLNQIISFKTHTHTHTQYPNFSGIETSLRKPKVNNPAREQGRMLSAQLLKVLHVSSLVIEFHRII